eukprot:2561005-Amphidinium_carterae.2
MKHGTTDRDSTPRMMALGVGSCADASAMGLVCKEDFDLFMDKLDNIEMSLFTRTGKLHQELN